jgi:hypothetical protein
MQNALAMNSDVKALLTLWLLKTGTKTQEIQTVLQLAAASRVMVAEELCLGSIEEERQHSTAMNVAKLRCASEPNAAVVQISTMHSDIKALLTLALIKVGVGLDDIQTTLRLAAGSRAESDHDDEDAASTGEPVQQAPVQAAPAPSSRQSLRAAHLAPIPMREYAAA